MTASPPVNNGVYTAMPPTDDEKRRAKAAVVSFKEQLNVYRRGPSGRNDPTLGDFEIMCIQMHQNDSQRSRKRTMVHAHTREHTTTKYYYLHTASLNTPVRPATAQTTRVCPWPSRMAHELA